MPNLNDLNDFFKPKDFDLLVKLMDDLVLKYTPKGVYHHSLGGHVYEAIAEAANVKLREHLKTCQMVWGTQPALDWFIADYDGATHTAILFDVQPVDSKEGGE